MTVINGYSYHLIVNKDWRVSVSEDWDVKLIVFKKAIHLGTHYIDKEQVEVFQLEDDCIVAQTYDYLNRR
jgi:hypothetical protein